MILKNKIVFRFFFILSLLLIFPFPFNIYDKFEWPDEMVNSVFHKLIPWIGKHMLNLDKDITEFTGGSGDTTYDYVLLLFFVFISILGTLIWTILQKSNKNNEKFNYIFEVGLRYYLGYMMLYYGLSKVFYLQFSELSFFKLLHTYGNSSPMGLVWTFMGASKGYTIFSGLMESIGGLLLLHKRTKLLGGLVLIPVMANVAAINFFYDVPVKLFSTQLLIFAILIVLPDYKRLISVILYNKSVAPNPDKAFFVQGKLKKVKPILKWIMAALIIFVPLNTSITYSKQLGSNAPKPELYGLYEVNHFIANSDTIQPMIRDTVPWRYIAIEYQESIQIYRNDMKRIGFESKVDTVKKEIFMKAFEDSTNIFTLKYKKTDSTLILSGIIKNDTVKMVTKKRYKKDFILINRGFRWINEKPFHR